MAPQEKSNDVHEDSENSFSSVVDQVDSSESERSRRRNAPATSTPDEDSPEVIVRRENRAVFMIRIMVLLVLLVAASATAWIVFTVVREAERDAFHSEYDGIATKVSCMHLESESFE